MAPLLSYQHFLNPLLVSYQYKLYCIASGVALKCHFRRFGVPNHE